MIGIGPAVQRTFKICLSKRAHPQCFPLFFTLVDGHVPGMDEKQNAMAGI